MDFISAGVSNTRPQKPNEPFILRGDIKENLVLLVHELDSGLFVQSTQAVADVILSWYHFMDAETTAPIVRVSTNSKKCN